MPNGQAVVDTFTPQLNQVMAEYFRATDKFGPFYSAMEGQAIVAEEFDEFTHAVRHEGINRAREEAVQLAAMAIRFLVDCPADRKQKNER